MPTISQLVEKAERCLLTRASRRLWTPVLSVVAYVFAFTQQPRRSLIRQ